MRRLIVNADDYGLSPGVDEGIRACAARGVVTSVSVLAARVTGDGLRALLDVAPDVGLGLHVDLTEDLVRYREGDAERRVREQVERFLDVAGRPPDHVDTHRHLHRGKADVLDALAATGLPVRADGASTRRELRRRGARCTDHFVGDVGPRSFWSAVRLRAALRDLGEGTTELMCHPGRGTDVPAGLRYREQREGELATFLSPRLRERIERRGVKLATFRDLVPGGGRP